MNRSITPLLLLLAVSIALPSMLYAVGMGGMSGMVDKVEIQTAEVGRVTFSHSKHGTRCNQCHPRMYKKQRSNQQITMKAMEQGRSCGACHNGQRAFTVAENCTTCHAGEMVFPDDNLGNVTFSHEVHGMMFGCTDCHPGLFKPRKGANQATMGDMEEGMSCGACHDGATAFGVDDCDACHQM